MSSLVESGAGTGWTVSDKLSYYSDIVYKKLYSMRETLQLGNNSYSYYISLFFYILKKEKSLLTRRQFAWLKNKIFGHQRLNVEHLFCFNYYTLYMFFKNLYTSKVSLIHINKTTILENKELFYLWLVGFSDGVGTFSIENKNNNWYFYYILSINIYNIKILHFIKSQLKVGSIFIDKKGKQAHFIIQDLNALNSIIFPIFDKYSLLTSKHFYYIKFKNSYNILTDKSLDKLKKDKLINQIVLTKATKDYISPIWSSINNNVINFNSASTIMKKVWLIGFVESKGSFQLVINNKLNSTISKKIVHSFEITLKRDEIVITAIKYLLGIKTNIKLNDMGNFTLKTSNSRAIENIIKYFANTLRGMKSLEYKIWSRTYKKT
jgi:hypothetical protein